MAADGWRFDLSYAGEKGLASSVILEGKAYIGSFTPADLFSDTNSCVPESGQGQLYVMDISDGDRDVIPVGPIIPDTPALYFSSDSSISLLVPFGVPDVEVSGGVGGGINCKGGVCDIFQSAPPPYGNYWFQEAY